MKTIMLDYTLTDKNPDFMFGLHNADIYYDGEHYYLGLKSTKALVEITKKEYRKYFKELKEIKC